MTAPPLMEMPLDDALLKVLSSDSRREILRLLTERRMTGAELAGRLELGKPAVAEHLKKLLDTQLVERFDDDERRWVYYGLTPRGRSILEPQKVRFYLVLGVAVLGLLVGLALALTFVAMFQAGHAGLANDATDSASFGMGSQGLSGIGTASGLTSGSPISAAATPASAATPPAVLIPTYSPSAEYVQVAAPTAAPGGETRYLLGPKDTLPAALVGRRLVIERVDPVNHTLFILVPADNGTLPATPVQLQGSLPNATVIGTGALPLADPSGIEGISQIAAAAATTGETSVVASTVTVTVTTPVVPATAELLTGVVRVPVSATSSPAASHPLDLVVESQTAQGVATPAVGVGPSFAAAATATAPVVAAMGTAYDAQGQAVEPVPAGAAVQSGNSDSHMAARVPNQGASLPVFGLVAAAIVALVARSRLET